jgi:hypothetical protein
VHNRLFYCFFLRGLLQMETGGAAGCTDRRQTRRAQVRSPCGAPSDGCPCLVNKDDGSEKPGRAGTGRRTVEVEVDAVATWDASSVTSCYGLQLGPPPGPV